MDGPARFFRAASTRHRVESWGQACVQMGARGADTRFALAVEGGIDGPTGPTHKPAPVQPHGVFRALGSRYVPHSTGARASPPLHLLRALSASSFRTVVPGYRHATTALGSSRRPKTAGAQVTKPKPSLGAHFTTNSHFALNISSFPQGAWLAWVLPGMDGLAFTESPCYRLLCHPADLFSFLTRAVCFFFLFFPPCLPKIAQHSASQLINFLQTERRQGPANPISTSTHLNARTALAQCPFVYRLVPSMATALLAAPCSTAALSALEWGDTGAAKRALIAIAWSPCWAGQDFEPLCSVGPSPVRPKKAWRKDMKTNVFCPPTQGVSSSAYEPRRYRRISIQRDSGCPASLLAAEDPIESPQLAHPRAAVAFGCIANARLAPLKL